MKDNIYFSQLTLNNNNYNNMDLVNNMIEEEKDEFNDIEELNPIKKKKIKKNKKENFPLIETKNRTKKISKKIVNSEFPSKFSKSSPKNLSIKIDENNTIDNQNKEKLNLNLKSEIPLILYNNDSSNEDSNKNDTIHTNTNTNNQYTTLNFNKSIYACKNKKKKTNDSESLNDVFKKLLDIKHKIRGIKDQKKYKITKFNTNLSVPKNPHKLNIKLSSVINNHNHTNNTRNKGTTTFYHTHYPTFNSTPSNLNRKPLKTNINMVNFRKSANSYRRFNEHIKYILHIRENEMNSLAVQFQKALEENEKEKDFHYKNRIFPLEIIERLNKIRDDLTLNKYRNEYMKRLDRYDIHPLKKILDNEKKNVKKIKTKFFKGIFSQIANIK